MAPVPKLTYFAAMARAEVIRFLLKYGGIEFEDIRLGLDKVDWLKLKPSTPFGQLPTYEEDGKVAWQSIAIARYVAKKVNLVGRNDWEDLEIDAIVDTILEFRNKIVLHYWEQNKEYKAKLKAELVNETIPFYCERFDKIAKENNGHMALGKLTWADIYFTSMFLNNDYLLDGDIMAKYPNLVAVRSNVLKIPAIKSWVEARPKTNF